MLGCFVMGNNLDISKIDICKLNSSVFERKEVLGYDLLNEIISILDDIGCLNKHIKNIFITNPFVFNQSTKEIKKVIELFYKIGLDNLWFIFDSDPYLLNNKCNFYKRIYDRLKKEDKSLKEIANYFYYELREVI